MTIAVFGYDGGCAMQYSQPPMLAPTQVYGAAGTCDRRMAHDEFPQPVSRKNVHVEYASAQHDRRRRDNRRGHPNCECLVTDEERQFINQAAIRIVRAKDAIDCHSVALGDSLQCAS